MRFLIDRRAVAAVESAVIFPIFLFFLLAVLGTGIDGFYQRALDDAVRYAARQIQISGPASGSASGFVSSVCSQFAYLAADCNANLTYQVQASPATSGFNSLVASQLPASGRLSNVFFAGTVYAANVNVMVQVAYPLPFTLPYVAKLITGTGTPSILATATVRAEPF
jgi:hypothetical protein